MDAQPAAEEGIPPAAETEPEPETEEVGEQLDRDGSVPSTAAVEATSGWLRAESRAPATDDALHQQAASPQRLGGLSRSQAGVDTSGSQSRKTLICIRHGTSLAQGVPEKIRYVGLEYTDAKLAPAGRQQALDLGSALRKQALALDESFDTVSLSLMSRTDLVVVSPLTRALQTACHIFGDGDVVATPAVICHPAVAEIGRITENTPRALQKLRKDKQLTSLQFFPSINFSLVEAEPAWPPGAPLPTSSGTVVAGKFLQWLKKRPEQVITIVSHNQFLKALLGTTKDVPNCIPILAEVDTSGNGALARTSVKELQQVDNKIQQRRAPATDDALHQQAQHSREMSSLRADAAPFTPTDGSPPPRLFDALDDWPVEVWTIVASFLDARSLGRLCCTAKLFCAITNWDAGDWSLVEEGARQQAQLVDASRPQRQYHAWLRTRFAANDEGSPREGETWLKVLRRLDLAEKERATAFSILLRHSLVADHHIQRERYQPGRFLWFVGLDPSGQPSCEKVDTTNLVQTRNDTDGWSALVASLRLDAAFHTRNGYHIYYWRRNQRGARVDLGPPTCDEYRATLDDAMRIGASQGGAHGSRNDDPVVIQTFEHGALTWNARTRGGAEMILTG